MFRDDDLRTYAIPATRTLEHLKELETHPLTSPEINTTLTNLERTLNNTFDVVTTNKNLDGDDQTPDNKYLPSYHIPQEDLDRWVEYNAQYGIQETEYGDRARIEFELVISEPGDIYVRATTRPHPFTTHTAIHRGALNEFTPTTAATAATNAYGNTIGTMTEDGLSGSEIIDYLELDLHERPPENWAETRGITYEGVRKTREAAREKLTAAGWPDELTEKPTETIEDLYNEIIDTHSEVIDSATDTIFSALPAEHQTDTNNAVLRVTVIETFAPSMHFGDMSIPKYELFLHKLGEMPINAEVHARKVRMLTDHGAVNIDEFRDITDEIFHPLNGAFDTDLPLDDLTDE